jgi:hypothetical protein
MGYSTDFLGHLDIEPPLNDAEIDYLTAFFASRRCQRDGGPYDVPGNPRAESLDSSWGERGDECADGQPNLWCDWTVCWEGCCLTWNGTEKSYSMIPWLRFLIAHFLGPEARAADDPRFAGFTFDHRLSGVMVGCRRDTREMFVIRVDGTEVVEETLRRPDASYLDCPPLAYEEAIDRDLEYRERRRRRRRSNVVVSLDDRR